MKKHITTLAILIFLFCCAYFSFNYPPSNDSDAFLNGSYGNIGVGYHSLFNATAPNKVIALGENSGPEITDQSLMLCITGFPCSKITEDQYATLYKVLREIYFKQN